MGAACVDGDRTAGHVHVVEVEAGDGDVDRLEYEVVAAHHVLGGRLERHREVVVDLDVWGMVLVEGIVYTEWKNREEERITEVSKLNLLEKYADHYHHHHRWC